MNRSLLAPLFLALAAPLIAGAQQVTVSGVVVQGSPPARVAGATVRLSGSGAYFTDLDGWFRFEEVTPGPHTLTVQALGYRTRTLDLVIGADTVFAVELEPDPLPLDSLLVRARTVRVRGNIVDARTGLRVLYAEVTLEPEYPTMGAISGQFTVRDVPMGQPLTILVEALEYLPARVAVAAEADTTLTIELEPDPVAIQMLERQVERLKTRSRAVPYAIDEAGREEIRLSGVGMIGELVRRRLPPGAVGDRPPYGDRSCVFLDDNPIHFSFLMTAVDAGMVERVEIFGREGKMIRVYTRRYLGKLMHMGDLSSIVYLGGGLGSPVCR